jgi:hypothetical protein
MLLRIGKSLPAWMSSKGGGVMSEKATLCVPVMAFVDVEAKDFEEAEELVSDWLSEKAEHYSIMSECIGYVTDQPEEE